MADQNYDIDAKFLQNVGKKTLLETIWVAPLRNEAQKKIFNEIDDSENASKQTSSRLIKRLIRLVSSRFRTLRLTQPYYNWDFLQGSQTQGLLKSGLLSEKDVARSVCALGAEPTEEQLKDAVLKVGLRKKALNDWCSMDEKEGAGDQCSGLPSRVQHVIDEVKSSYKSQWEKKFLDNIINPRDLEEGWDQIALNPDIKEGILRLLNQPSNTGVEGYGILKHARIGGAILYGPPGTGKTQLSRVLARESNAVMISVSGADISIMYVGESEKAIQGLFSLARMICPCIVFIDEADTLFRSRKSTDKGWERSQINQLLCEMDGVRKTKLQPFVLLATNYPRELDHAVLRRVPARFYIGLPNHENRHKIFKSFLIEEATHGDVDFNHLAEISVGYSGSDIETVCVQAALSCDSVISDTDTRRLLKRCHFEQSFKKCSPNTSKVALEDIKAFAKDFDSGSVACIDADANIKRWQPKRAFPESMESLKTSGQNIEPLKKKVLESSSLSKPNTSSGISGNEDPPTKHAETQPATGLNENGTSDSGSKPSSDAKPGVYCYSPLKPNSTQIRVLSLDQGCDDLSECSDETLRCTLRTVDLDNYNQFFSGFHETLSQRTQLLLWDWTCRSYKKRFSEVSEDEGQNDSPSSSRDDVLDFLAKVAPEMDTLSEETAKMMYTLLEEMESQVDTLLQDEGGKIFQRFAWGDYIALSYVWGDPSIRRDILVDGHRFSVTENLYQALLRLSNLKPIQNQTLHIWADAICINQNDLVERATEVKKMGLIYSSSYTVMAWLGNPSAEEGSRLPRIREIVDVVKKGFQAEVDPVDLFEGAAPHESERLSLCETAWNIIHLPYWRRVWIMQEVALAPAISFWYGNSSFTGKEIILLNTCAMKYLESDNLANPPRPDHTLPDLIQIYHILRYLAPAYDKKRELTTVELIGISQACRATDLRDKVYGLLGMLSKPIAARIYPDYGPSVRVQDVFIMFTKAIFEADGNLNTMGKITQNPLKTPNLPSWAFDLRGDPRLNFMLKGDDNRTYRANIDMPVGKFSFAEQDRLIQCEGVIADFASSLGPVIDWFPGLPHEREIESETKKRKGSPTPDFDWRLTVARVLSQDTDLELHTTSPSILDIPWPEVTEDDIDTCRKMSLEAAARSGKKLLVGPLAQMKVNNPTVAFLRRNGQFEIGGRPLKSYFRSAKEYFKATEEYIGTAKFEKDEKALAHHNTTLTNYLDHHRLLITRTGLLGIGPVCMKPGDTIAVISACDMPIVLRPIGSLFEVIGPCFVEGLMRGETAQALKEGSYKIRAFYLC